MSKYNKLWDYITIKNKDEIILSFDEIKNILGFDVDHSFLKYKNELNNYKIKISLKDKKMVFKKLI